MSRIQKVIREIDNLRDFYGRTEDLRRKIQNKANAQKPGEQQTAFKKVEQKSDLA